MATDNTCLLTKPPTMKTQMLIRNGFVYLYSFVTQILGEVIAVFLAFGLVEKLKDCA